MNITYLILGSNRGNRLLNISKAVVSIHKRVGRIIQRSYLYETAPWGFKDEIFFVNFVIGVETNLSPDELLKEIQLIENALGRIRIDDQYISRVIDIDILFYNNLNLNKDNLIIPHPKIQDRKFVLVPLNEIIPDFIHPGLNKSINTLFRECEDESEVRKFHFR